MQPTNVPTPPLDPFRPLCPCAPVGPVLSSYYENMMYTSLFPRPQVIKAGYKAGDEARCVQVCNVEVGK